MRYRRGPAAVNGNESHEDHWSDLQADWEGVASRMIRESENLPESNFVLGQAPGALVSGNAVFPEET